jgi:hypothetical protein
MSDPQDRIAELQERRRLAELRLRALLEALPPLHGSLTELEIEHLRMLRAMSDRSFGAVASLAEDLLLRDAEHGELVQPLRARPFLAYSSRPSRRSSE